MNAFNVVQKTGTDPYRSAVERILRDIMRGSEDSLRDIAENISVSEGTLYNALHQRSDLSAAFLARLGTHYGASFLNPYFALMGAQAAPIEKRRLRDILPLCLRYATKKADARDPDGPGGPTEVPQERAAILPVAKELHRELSNEIADIEAFA